MGSNNRIIDKNKQEFVTLQLHIFGPEEGHTLLNHLCPPLVFTMRQNEWFLSFILLHEKFLQFDWVRAVVFQLNLKYLNVKITKLLRVVV